MLRREFVKGLMACWPLAHLGKTIQFSKNEKIPSSSYSEGEILRLFCCDCVEQMLPVFKESFPEDDRLHRLIAMNREYAAGKISYAPIKDLRREMWEFWQVVSDVDLFGYASRSAWDNTKQVIEGALCATANPISQDNVHFLLDKHLWVLRISWLGAMKDYLTQYQKWQEASPTSLANEAYDRLEEAIKRWQIRRLTSYFTGKEEVLAERLPRDFVSVKVLFGIDEEYLDGGEERKRVDKLARKWQLGAW